MSCVVVQGRIYPEILPGILSTYRDFPNKIASTWTTEDPVSIEILRQNGFKLIVQDPPEHKTPTNYMSKSMLRGLDLAESLGFTHVFRMRADVSCNKFSRIVNILENEYSPLKLSFIMLCRNHPDSEAYLCDHIIYGPISEQRKYWSAYQPPGDTRYSEAVLQEEYFNIPTVQMSYEFVKDKVQFFINRCYREGIEFHFTKPGYVEQGDLVKRYLWWNKESSLALQG